ncbi:cupin domain-containing protein, partial [Candidatus Fermentibacteria bacterium]|nr:cupin domain-containing protein [Candidatus Fermentibacteria bacterium]
MHSDALRWIQQLGLAPHAEGGYFAETYRAELTIPHQVLPGHY